MKTAREGIHKAKATRRKTLAALPCEEKVRPSSLLYIPAPPRVKFHLSPRTTRNQELRTRNLFRAASCTPIGNKLCFFYTHRTPRNARPRRPTPLKLNT